MTTTIFRGSRKPQWSEVLKKLGYQIHQQARMRGGGGIRSMFEACDVRASNLRVASASRFEIVIWTFGFLFKSGLLQHSQV